MKFRLNLNIGTVDQARLGLTEATAGEVVDVDDPKAIDELTRQNWGTPLDRPARVPAAASNVDAHADAERPANAKPPKK